MNEMIDHIPALTEFEQQYLSLRIREGRIYSDVQLRHLPLVSNDHPLANEWKLREFSSGKLRRYLMQLRKPLEILEIGCGNGWLSHQLSTIKGCKVTGIDVNSVELEQASRVFESPSLHFVYGDIRQVELTPGFDVILFAASLQYFSSLPEAINAALRLLDDSGEIHIVDTHFYGRNDLEGAAQRSKNYFNKIGFPLMEQYYFHHSLENLQEFSYEILYNPGSFKNKILKQSPFPWIRIKKC